MTLCCCDSLFELTVINQKDRVYFRILPKSGQIHSGNFLRVGKYKSKGEPSHIKYRESQLQRGGGELKYDKPCKEINSMHIVSQRWMTDCTRQ